jgi:hypothetical protein
VRIDLNDGERPAVVQRLDDRDRHRIVAADDDRGRAAGDDRGDGRADRAAVRSRVRLAAGEVAAVDRRDRAREDRPADVEIDVVKVGRIAGDRLADGFRRAGATGPDRRIRGRAGRAKDRDGGPQRREISGLRQAQERLARGGAEHRADILASGHRALPFSRDRLL